MDMLCTREQPRVKDNIIVDYDGDYQYLIIIC